MPTNSACRASSPVVSVSKLTLVCWSNFSSNNDLPTGLSTHWYWWLTDCWLFFEVSATLVVPCPGGGLKRSNCAVGAGVAGDVVTGFDSGL